ncbi:MAG: Ig-like domain-containing protein [Acidobacteria bacterium]|nr:Ig-like domain-containing protein [Acidobacteriota bacterium]
MPLRKLLVVLSACISASLGQNLTPYAGNGQIVRSGAISRGFVAQVLDVAGNPIPGATVNWLVTTGIGPTLAISQSSTDLEGKASTLFVAETLVSGQRIKTVKVTASTTIQGTVRTFEFSAVILASNVTVSAEVSSILSPTNPIGAGTTLANAVSAQISSNAGGVTEPLAGVALFADPEGRDGPLASCANNTLSDNDGRVSCNLVAGGRIAAGFVRVSAGGLAENTFISWRYPLRVVGGPPASLIVIQGDGQSGVSGDLVTSEDQW